LLSGGISTEAKDVFILLFCILVKPNNEILSKHLYFLLELNFKINLHKPNLLVILYPKSREYGSSKNGSTNLLKVSGWFFLIVTHPPDSSIVVVFDTTNK